MIHTNKPQIPKKYIEKRNSNRVERLQIQEVITRSINWRKEFHLALIDKRSIIKEWLGVDHIVQIYYKDNKITIRKRRYGSTYSTVKVF